MDAEDKARTLSESEIVTLNLGAGVYALLIEQLGFLASIAGHQKQAKQLRAILLNAGGVTEVPDGC
jgi:hypothetical protein